MGDTSIQWTDKTWNPISGCSKVSQGCKFCYAERIWPRVYGKFRPFTDVQCHSDRLEQPLHWKKPSRVFVNSMSDLFHEKVPFEFILAVLAHAVTADRHTYQILTKRPERALEFFRWMDTEAPYRVEVTRKCFWWGVSVEDQPNADKRIPLLVQFPVSIRFVSAEPLIGEISFRWMPICHENAPYTAQRHDSNATNHLDGLRRLNWIIVGGESGAHARPFEIGWAREIVAQCKEAGVPVFMKQLGRRPVDGVNRTVLTLNDSHGGDMAEWPEDLRIREYPKV